MHLKPFNKFFADQAKFLSDRNVMHKLRCTRRRLMIHLSDNEFSNFHFSHIFFRVEKKSLSWVMFSRRNEFLKPLFQTRRVLRVE